LQKQIHPKHTPVLLPNTVAHPWTMMVERKDTFLTLMAVTDAVWLRDAAELAVVQGLLVFWAG